MFGEGWWNAFRCGESWLDLRDGSIAIESDVMWTSSKQHTSKCGDVLFGGRQIAYVDRRSVEVWSTVGLV